MVWRTRRDNKKHFKIEPKRAFITNETGTITPTLGAINGMREAANVEAQFKDYKLKHPLGHPNADTMARYLDDPDKRILNFMTLADHAGQLDDDGGIQLDEMGRMFDFDLGFRIGRFRHDPALIEIYDKRGRLGIKLKMVRLTPFGKKVAAKLKNVSRIIGT